MPGVYLMPNGKVASVDLGDGRVSLVSRAKFEECCCPPPCECPSGLLDQYSVTGDIRNDLFGGKNRLKTKGNALVQRNGLSCLWSGSHNGERCLADGTLCGDFTFDVVLELVCSPQSVQPDGFTGDAYWRVYFGGSAFSVFKVTGQTPTGNYSDMGFSLVTGTATVS